MCEFCKNWNVYNGKNKPLTAEIQHGDAEIVGHYIEFDNSGGEYYCGKILINYCPICGREFKNDI